MSSKVFFERMDELILGGGNDVLILPSEDPLPTDGCVSLHPISCFPGETEG